MKRISKRTALVAGVAALAAGGGGAAIAATQFDSPTARSNAIVSDAASQLGIEPAKLSAALEKAEENQVDADLAAGRITKEQADALKAAIEAGTVPLVGPGRGLARGGRVGFAADLGAAADYLGLTETELMSDLRSGKSLADVAKAQGKNVDGLVSVLVDAAKKQLQERVAAGTLTQAQEQKIESNLQQWITGLVDGKLPMLPPLGWKLRLPGLAASGLESAAATYLGVSEDQLETDLRNGQTLADVAKAQGKSVEGLVSALVVAAKKQLDAAVSAGTLTASEAQKIEADLKQTVTDFVNGDRLLPGLGFGHFRTHGFRLPSLGLPAFAPRA